VRILGSAILGAMPATECTTVCQPGIFMQLALVVAEQSR
jgi:hypothetical protein